MKKIVLTLIIVLLGIYVSKAQIFCSYKKNIKYPYPSFYTFNKYPSIYSDKDAQTIQYVQKQLDKYRKKYRCYVKFDEKYNHYNRLTNIGLKRYEKKRNKALKKALKYGQKYIDMCMVAYLDLDSLYMAKIISLQNQKKLPDSLTYLADSLKKDLNQYNFQISNAKAKAISQKGIKRLELFIKACELNKQRLEVKEKYIGLLLQDKNIISILKQKYGNAPKPFTNEKTKPDTNAIKKQKGQQAKRKSKYYIPRIDELSPYLKLSAEERLKINTYKQTLEKIQNTEALFNTTFVKDTASLMKRLGELYWQAYNLLYQIYIPHLNETENLQVKKYYSTADQMYKQYKKSQDIGYLWQSVNYLIPAIITAENIIASKNNLGSQYKLSDIIPIAQANQTAKPQSSKKEKPKSNVNAKKKKTNCTPLGLVYTYDIDNPTPRILRESGTYYRIYVGTTTLKVVPKEFANYQPITYIKICKEPQNKAKSYYVGRYTDKQKAIADAQKLHREFSLPTKVVKFIDGHPQGTIKKVYNQQKTNIANNDIPEITSTNYLIYAVRLGTYSSEKSPNELKHLNKLYYMTTPDGKYAYFDAPYYSYSQAQQALTKLKSLGYTDAYIMAFNNRQAISIAQAKKIESKIKGNSNVIFGVQVGAFSKPLSQEQYRRLYGKLGSNYQVSMIEKGSRYVYYVYAGTTYNHAKNLKAKIRQLGYTDAFVIAIRNNRIIPLSEAIK